MSNFLDDILRQAELLRQHPDSTSRLQTLREQATGLADTINDVLAQTYDGSDESGTVECTIRGDGKITGLKITARAMQQHDHRALGQAIVEAVRAASATMAVAMKEEMESRLGTTMPADPDQPADLNALIDAAKNRKEQPWT